MFYTFSVHKYPVPQNARNDLESFKIWNGIGNEQCKLKLKYIYVHYQSYGYLTIT